MTRSFPFVGTLIHEKINVTVTLISKTGNSTLEHPVVTHKADVVRHLTYHRRHLKYCSKHISSAYSRWVAHDRNGCPSLCSRKNPSCDKICDCRRYQSNLLSLAGVALTSVGIQVKNCHLSPRRVINRIPDIIICSAIFPHHFYICLTSPAGVAHA